MSSSATASIGFGTRRLEAEFPSTGALELKAGYLSVEVLEQGIVELDDRFIHGPWYSSDLGGGSGGTSGLQGSLWRFGFGNRQGYGYDLKDAAIVPYFLTTASWTELSTDRPTTLGQTDNEILNRYEGTFRFGHSAENGIRVNIGRTFSLMGGYEVNVIYPRFVFWEWLGSYTIAAAGNGVVMWFGKDILEASPDDRADRDLPHPGCPELGNLSALAGRDELAVQIGNSADARDRKVRRQPHVLNGAVYRRAGRSAAVRLTGTSGDPFLLQACPHGSSQVSPTFHTLSGPHRRDVNVALTHSASPARVLAGLAVLVVCLPPAATPQE